MSLTWQGALYSIGLRQTQGFAGEALYFPVLPH